MADTDELIAQAKVRHDTTGLLITDPPKSAPKRLPRHGTSVSARASRCQSVTVGESQAPSHQRPRLRACVSCLVLPSMPSPDRTLPGRAEPMPIPERHVVNGAPLAPPWPDGTRTAVFALGCFWGAEKAFWSLPGVISTAVGYAGGATPNPTYREACSGMTGHAESVLVAYDPERGLVRAAAKGVLGAPRPDPGDAPGQ